MARRAASIGSSGSLRNSSSKISRIGMSPTAFASRSHNGWSGHGRERHVNQPAGEPGARDESATVVHTPQRICDQTRRHILKCMCDGFILTEVLGRGSPQRAISSADQKPGTYHRGDAGGIARNFRSLTITHFLQSLTGAMDAFYGSCGRIFESEYV